MEQRGSVIQPDFRHWKRPAIDGTTALQPQSTASTRPSLSVVPEVGMKFPQVSFRDSLVRARNEFATAERGKKKQVKAYEVEQDVVLYKTLVKEKGKEGYEGAKRDLDAYMEMQLKTHLGERLNVGISTLQHKIIDNEIRVADTDEPFLAMLQRGRDYRRIHGNPVDWNREEAEVVGFERIQKELADSNTPIGTMLFFVSPQGDIENGSIYKSNFYDVYLKVSETRAVSSRYTSGLSKEESQNRLKLLDNRYDRDDVPTDAEFIANPITIIPSTKGLESLDKIHGFMHGEHRHMSRANFAVVINACQPLIEEYRQSLIADPNNIAEHKRRLDILMNFADNVAQEVTSIPEGRVVALRDEKGLDVRPWVPPQIDRDALARQEVRVAATGCGSSGGESSSLFSVAEAGQDNPYTGENAKNDPNLCSCGGQEPHFHCPGKGGACRHAIIVGEGTNACPKCGAGQVC